MAIHQESRITIPPWKGKDYEKGIRNTKLMILGESAVFREDSNYDEKDFINDYLTDHYISGKENNQFFTKLTKLLNREIQNDENDRNGAWNSVAFYEYIQSGIPDAARKEPHSWEKSRKPFLETIEKFQPDRLLVLGNRLWVNLQGEEWERLDDDRFWLKSKSGKKIPSTFITHPSAPSFSYEKASPRLNMLLEGRGF